MTDQFTKSDVQSMGVLGTLLLSHFSDLFCEVPSLARLLALCDAGP